MLSLTWGLCCPQVLEVLSVNTGQEIVLASAAGRYSISRQFTFFPLQVPRLDLHASPSPSLISSLQYTQSTSRSRSSSFWWVTPVFIMSSASSSRYCRCKWTSQVRKQSSSGQYLPGKCVQGALRSTESKQLAHKNSEKEPWKPNLSHLLRILLLIYFNSNSLGLSFSIG